MSNDVQSHERAEERAAGEERRASVRHAAASLGSVTARIIGGSPVDLVNFSSRGVLFECDSRLLIGARASVRITTGEANLIVTGRVVRSRVKGLVNGALRYDAALFLDSELALSPKPVNGTHAPAAAEATDAAAEDDGDIAFESDLDASFDPSPIEAYLAASEESLAEVAGAVDPVDPATAETLASIDAAVADVEAAPFQVETAPEFETAAAFDAAPEFEVAPEFEAAPEFDIAPEFEAAAAAEPPPLVVETAAVAEDEPVAFEADAEIAFEPAAEFSYEEAADAVEAPADVLEVSPPALAEEPAGTSMFDATYVPPVEEAFTSASVFVVTAPTPVAEASSSSMFDSRPSESYGEATVADALVPAAEAVDVEGEVAFEAEDAVMFEAAFEEPVEPVAEAVPPPLAALAPPPLPALAAEPVVQAVSEPHVEAPAEPAIEAEADPVVEAATDVLLEVNVVLEPAVDELIDLPATVPSRDDRVLAQFAATVPQDLADLQRIAADNQW